MNPEQQAAEVEQKEAQEQQRQDMLRNLLQPSARDRRALAGPSSEGFRSRVKAGFEGSSHRRDVGPAHMS